MGVLFPVTSLSANKLRAAKLFIREREGFIYQSASAVTRRQIGARFGDGSVEGLNYFNFCEGKRRNAAEREPCNTTCKLISSADAHPTAATPLC
jgi:hypothetical protein